MKINTFFPSLIGTYGVGHACQSIALGMQQAGVDVNLFSVSSNKHISTSINNVVLPHIIERFGYKLFSNQTLINYCQKKFLASFKDGDIGYLWPSSLPNATRATRDKTQTLILENINTHQTVSKAILDREFKRLCLEPVHNVTDEKIILENESMALADYIFSPSTEVTQSLLKVNVSPSKIIETSYGIGHNDIVTPEVLEKRKENKQLTAVFVGRIGIRKGAHLLLKYWVDANVQGTLKLVGNIEDSARQIIEPYLKRSDIEHVEFVHDLKTLYSNSDVFLFPSLEEGSPLVTYQAIAAGLPCIVSKMGAGGILTDRKDGIIIDPFDGEKWIESIKQIFEDNKLRENISNNAYKLAPEYLWSRVGQKRIDCLKSRLTRNK